MNTFKSINNPSRREWLKCIGAAPLAALSGSLSAASNNNLNVGLPAKKLFAVKGTFLNAAFTHPMSILTANAAKAYTNRRLVNDQSADDVMGTNRVEAMQLFGQLINAQPEELAWIPSTMVGENFIVSGLGLPGSKARVVTDAYHFHGSLYLYGQLTKQGLDVHVVRPKDNGIDLADLEQAITPQTKLVALSLVSTINGFQHDLKAVCQLAHAKGAMVFADIVQAAGAVPIDVKDSGIDFCACSSYKWLMADFGAGFLYVRKDRLPLLARSQYGFRQVADFQTHVFPFDLPGENVFDFEALNTTAGYFQIGTIANGTMAALRQSLQYIVETGVASIQKYRQPMINRLQHDLPAYNFIPMTPTHSTSPIVSFAYKDAARILKQPLENAGINISLYPNRIRISPSVYNDISEVEKLIDVLKTAGK